MMAKTMPMCRYNHGALERQEEVWSLEQMVRNDPASRPLFPFSKPGRQFVLSLFRCPICGYVELFDDEEAQA